MTLDSTTDAETIGGLPPDVPVLQLSHSPVKRFDFSWGAVPDAQRYELFERPTPGAPFELLADDLVGESVSIEMPLHLRSEASYRLRACNAAGCSQDSAVVDVEGSLVEAIGYLQASNAGGQDLFGSSVALSGDGRTLVVGAPREDGSTRAADDDDAVYAGAAYVFFHDELGGWTEQARLKAFNADVWDLFGYSVAVSFDGNTLAVGAIGERSTETGVGGQGTNDCVSESETDNDAGAVYVFVRDETGWSQQAYVKASNTGCGDRFGHSLALSADGNTLAVGARDEDGNGDLDENAGAVYIFSRAETNWAQEKYLTGTNAEAGDLFGESVALSNFGDTLAVGAIADDGPADAIPDGGAVYVFVRTIENDWEEQAYLRAFNAGEGDLFGTSVALDDTGERLVVGAPEEESTEDPLIDELSAAGAAYLFERTPPGTWQGETIIKAAFPGAGDRFGGSVSLSADGSLLSVGAGGEASAATAIGGDAGDDSAPLDGAISAGAAYVFRINGLEAIEDEIYVKASHSGEAARFGFQVSMSVDGRALAVGAVNKDGGCPEEPENCADAGAIYLY